MSDDHMIGDLVVWKPTKEVGTVLDAECLGEDGTLFRVNIDGVDFNLTGDELDAYVQ